MYKKIEKLNMLYAILTSIIMSICMIKKEILPFGIIIQIYITGLHIGWIISKKNNE